VDDPPAGCHLDFHVDDVPGAAARARELGASVVSAEEGLVVLRSPAGLSFCLVPWAGERSVPAPVRDSLVDQMCLDVPVAVFEGELGFWRALTGWERRSSDLGEFELLLRPPGLPLRLLMQRTGGQAVGMHLDLAARDPAGTVAWHVASGASVVRRVPGQWTTLRDPVGREYCVTERWPSS